MKDPPRAGRRVDVQRSPSGSTSKAVSLISRPRGMRAKPADEKRPRASTREKTFPRGSAGTRAKEFRDPAPVERVSGALATEGTRAKTGRSSHGCHVPKMLCTGSRRASVERNPVKKRKKNSLVQLAQLSTRGVNKTNSFPIGTFALSALLTGARR